MKKELFATIGHKEEYLDRRDRLLSAKKEREKAKFDPLDWSLPHKKEDSHDTRAA